MAKVLAADITARKKALEGDSFASGVAAKQEHVKLLIQLL